MTPRNGVTALDLPMADPLPEATQKYFDVCQDKLGMVPIVQFFYYAQFPNIDESAVPGAVASISKWLVALPLQNFLVEVWAPEFGGRKWVRRVRDWPSQSGVLSSGWKFTVNVHPV